MTNLAWLVPIFPLVGAGVAAIGGRWLKQNAHWPVVVGIGLSCALSFGLLNNVGDGSARLMLFDWIDVDNLRTPVEFRVDGLTTMMLSMVTFVATLIAIFASGYMAGDPAYPRFFACIGLFVFCMTGLVLSNNFLVTYAFWEGVGTCSYLLVGFWHAKPSAAAAAKKAFMVNRVGDTGFVIALFLIWVSFGGSFSYDVVLDPSQLNIIPQWTRLAIACLLFWGATAKSAQVPLYVWLPDAMEGPTPVSALIHAATMVTAGVYLIARSSLLVVGAPGAQVVIACVGCLTALLSALVALTQTDLKRVLAYSTVSQLGYMFMALGAGVGQVQRLAIVAGLFHLFTHAFFKALLFLASGSVMHSMGHVIDMRRFSGLRLRMPITCWTFAIGGLALAGIAPFAGFWSKDEILAALRAATTQTGGMNLGWVYWIIWCVALFTAFLTAFYTFRAFFMTFFGPEKLPSPNDPEADHAHEHEHEHEHEHDHSHDAHFGHESPASMWVPLVILAVCSALVGWLFGPSHRFERLIVEHTPGFAAALQHPEHAHATDWLSMSLGLLAGVVGIGLAYALYARPSGVPAGLAQRLGPLYHASLTKFGVDEAYDRTVIRPTWILARVASFLDKYLVDGLVRLIAWLPKMVGREFLSPLQNGLVQFYAAVGALGVALLLIFMLLS